MTINASPAYAAISPFIGWWIVVPPKRCSLQLQSRSGPNNDGSAITVAAIYYGKESSLDVSDIELATVGSVNCSDDDNYDDDSADEAGVRRDIVTRGKTMGEMEDD